MLCNPEKLCVDIAPIILMMLVFMLISGCGARDGELVRLPVNPVSGKVLHKKQPAEGAIVVFHKVGTNERKAIKPFAQTTADGTFQINYYNRGDGAPKGEYRATVVWPTPPPDHSPDLPGPDRLRGRYADPKTSKWRIKVDDKPLELEPFEIE